MTINLSGSYEANGSNKMKAFVGKGHCHCDIDMIQKTYIKSVVYTDPILLYTYRISSNRRPGGECIFKIGGVN
jgi:hypothetical protein